MSPDIRAFVDRRIDEALRARFPYPPLTDETAAAEIAKFRATFGRDLPPTYLEICRLADHLTDPTGGCLHGLQTVWRPGAEFPDYEGILEIHARHMLEVGAREDFVEFGDRDGVEPWGWDLTLDCFIRSDPNGRGIMGKFDTFEDMFRALFRLDRQQLKQGKRRKGLGPSTGPRTDCKAT
jgi:hypothetical protein